MGLATIFFACLLPSLDVTVHAEGPDGFGDVLILDENGAGITGQPFSLRQVRLLELEVAGFHALTQWLSESARPVRDLGANATRVSLPSARGSLYRYERKDPLVRGSRFGFFLVGANGRPRILAERPGVGLEAGVDPFTPWVAARADGKGLLIATTPDAGGDLFELDVVQGTSVNRTTSLAPLTLRPEGLLLVDTFGVGVTTSGIVRFSTSTGATAQFVDLGASAPTYYPGPLVASADGSTVAALAGFSPTACDVHVFGATGPAIRVTPAPVPLSQSGTPQSVANGPHLALSPDGSTCAWTTVGLARELYVRSVGLTAFAPDHVSSDARFLDTLDEISSIRFVTPDTVTFLLGSVELPEGTVEDGDFFSATLDPLQGTVSLTNLSLTSGDATAPFLSPGQVKSEGGVFTVDGLDGYLLHDDQSSNTGDIRLVQAGVTGYPVVVPDVAELEAFAVSAGQACFVARRDLPGDPRELWSLPLSAPSSPQLLTALPSATQLNSLVPDGANRFVYQRTAQGGHRLGRINASLGTVQELPIPTLPFVPTVGWSPSGGVVSTLFVGGMGWIAHWPTAGSPQLVGSIPALVRVLPGR